jgi:hypothetical protein
MIRQAMARGSGEQAPAASDAHAPKAQSRFFGRWTSGILITIIAIFATCALLWHAIGLRPYVAAFGAGLATFLSPMPGLLSPEARGKWLVAIIVSPLVGLGTWYATHELEEERSNLKSQETSLEMRLAQNNSAFVSIIAGLPPETRDKVFLGAAKRFYDLFDRKQYSSVLDLANMILAVEGDNGHGLYFAGEAYRVTRDRADMRGAFQHYLAGANHDPDAKDGDAATCSLRPHGYCGERTAWVGHLMANDYFYEAQSQQGTMKVDSLQTALSYERGSLSVRSAEFFHIQWSHSSCELIQEIERELKVLGEDAKDASALLAEHCG